VLGPMHASECGLSVLLRFYIRTAYYYAGFSNAKVSAEPTI
jgi:hypothetical protein